jgi:hypothetical protein
MYRVSSNRNRLWNDHTFDSFYQGRTLFPEKTTRYSKKHPFDCGTTQCPMCHEGKFSKRRFSLREPEIKEKLLTEWGVVEPEEFLES